jgi:hypothetical protein
LVPASLEHYVFQQKVLGVRHPGHCMVVTVPDLGNQP